MDITYSIIDGLVKVLSDLPLKGDGIVECARNLVRLNTESSVLTTARTSLIKKYADGAESIGQENPKFQEFIEEFNLFLGKKIDASLIPIKLHNVDTENGKVNQRDLATLIMFGLLEE